MAKTSFAATTFSNELRVKRVLGLCALALVTASYLFLVGIAQADSETQSGEQIDRSGDKSFLESPYTTSSGETQNLAQHMADGRWTLVMIWSVNCHVCQHETGVMSDFHDANKESLVTVVGLAIDGQGSGAQVDAFGERHDMRFPTLIGELVTVASSYQSVTEEGLRGTPTFMLFNPEGVLQGINPGPLRPEAVLEYIKRKS